jgi:hypothetical protein
MRFSVRVGNPVLSVNNETSWSDHQIFEGKGSSGCTSHNVAHFKAKIEDIRKNIRSKTTKQQTSGYHSPKSLICQANKNPVQAPNEQSESNLPPVANKVLSVRNDSSDSYGSGGIPSAMQ